MTQAILSSPFERNYDDMPRKVGVEIELGGLDIQTLSKLVADFFDLEVIPQSRYEYRLTGDSAGEWQVELDFDLLKRWGRKSAQSPGLVADLEQGMEDFLRIVSEQVVPLEIVSPPLELARLEQVEQLIETLHKAGAQGTSDRWVNAFGMQFNPEVPSFNSDCLLNFLRAFVCLQDWLQQRADINVARQITGYVEPFPKAYIEKIISADYQPDLDELIEDYLLDNPTRNRALDMMPLWMYLKPEVVKNVTQDVLIKSRPTFHYRLPDSDVGEAGWGMHQAWNDWIALERLVMDEAKLMQLCQAYSDFLQASPVARISKPWSKVLEDWGFSAQRD